MLDLKNTKTEKWANARTWAKEMCGHKNIKVRNLARALVVVLDRYYETRNEFLAEQFWETGEQLLVCMSNEIPIPPYLMS
jgi:hypothetical protein